MHFYSVESVHSLSEDELHLTTDMQYINDFAYYNYFKI